MQRHLRAARLAMLVGALVYAGIVVITSLSRST
jgi:hypothetical protein